ncbi:uncharacterized protein FOMMEDRAFT_156273 [Fomitiporia mediterranea MF3/22]|uniref:uncharacterized protein n=1 Tax=Fomitiporia mediterranea (strain MF3/22) TaxID=694068 RepID=UPI0004409B44|nr:uncharacterized protein FOMMEDRAFT_156273 [Fomitiporia mediterranea MF3/22]EJD02912.1 hypothetical protein FOMMEDRAFT_156273 [Fomitiporia mediterranea MF3/22]
MYGYVPDSTLPYLAQLSINASVLGIITGGCRKGDAAVRRPGGTNEQRKARKERRTIQDAEWYIREFQLISWREWTAAGSHGRVHVSRPETERVEIKVRIAQKVEHTNKNIEHQKSLYVRDKRRDIIDDGEGLFHLLVRHGLSVQTETQQIRNIFCSSVMSNCCFFRRRNLQLQRHHAGDTGRVVTDASATQLSQVETQGGIFDYAEFGPDPPVVARLSAQSLNQGPHIDSWTNTQLAQTQRPQCLRTQASTNGDALAYYGQAPHCNVVSGGRAEWGKIKQITEKTGRDKAEWKESRPLSARCCVVQLSPGSAFVWFRGPPEPPFASRPVTNGTFVVRIRLGPSQSGRESHQRPVASAHPLKRIRRLPPPPRKKRKDERPRPLAAHAHTNTDTR